MQHMASSMKRVAILVLLFAVAVTVYGQFRGMQWGATREEVIAEKGADYSVGENDSIRYHKEVPATDSLH